MKPEEITRKPSDQDRIQAKSYPEIVDAFHALARQMARTKRHRGRKLAPGVLLQLLVLEALTERPDHEVEAMVDRLMPLYEKIGDSPEPIELPRPRARSVGGGVVVGQDAPPSPAKQRKGQPNEPPEAIRRRLQGEHLLS